MMQQVIFHNIRSAHNVGAMFRTAEGAGVAKVWLTGYTPRPLDRFGRSVPEIAKTALGAEKLVPWEGRDNIHALVAELQVAGTLVVAIEQVPQAVSIYQFTPPVSVVYIFGNETTGIPADVVAVADRVVAIPMRGQKESLNVTTTAGIVLFHHEAHPIME